MNRDEHSVTLAKKAVDALLYTQKKSMKLNMYISTYPYIPDDDNDHDDTTL